MFKNKNERVFYSYGLPAAVLTVVTIIFAAAVFTATALAQKDESDATPEVGAPKIYSEREISGFDIPKLKDIAEADSIEQKSPLALYCLAQKYKSAGDAVKSEESFKRLLRTYPAHYLAPKACLELSLLYSQQKRESDEIEILTRVSTDYAQYTENATALYRLACIMKKRKNIDEMYKKLAEAESLFAARPEIIPLLFMSANEYLRNYNTAKALEKFEALLKIKELTTAQRALAMLGKAASYEYNAEPEKALMIYDEILKTRELDKSILAMADKSKANLAKAPKEPLVRIASEPLVEAAPAASATAESGLRQIQPASAPVSAPPPASGSSPTAEVRITD